VQALSAPEALLALIPNCYWVELGQTSALGNDMLCLGKVLRSVRVERLIFDFSERGFAAVEELITAPAAIGVQ
jgi:hypothetical protein